MVKVACAYGIPSIRIDRQSQLDQVDRALKADGPALIDVVLDPNQEFEPRSRARQLPDGRIVSPNLEDMYPFLDDAELMDNVIKDKDITIRTGLAQPISHKHDRQVTS